MKNILAAAIAAVIMVSVGCQPAYSATKSRTTKPKAKPAPVKVVQVKKQETKVLVAPKPKQVPVVVKKKAKSDADKVAKAIIAAELIDEIGDVFEEDEVEQRVVYRDRDCPEPEVRYIETESYNPFLTFLALLGGIIGGFWLGRKQ